MFRHHHRTQRNLCTMLLLCALLGLSLVACGNTPVSSPITIPASTPAQNATATSVSASTPGQPAPVPLSVTSVDISVNPASLSGYACGTQLTVTYTATFHFPANNAGAQVMFEYTTTNGRGTAQAGLTVPPGTTNLTYQFKWSGQLPPDHTQPGPGGVIVTSPNAYTSQLVGPTGACSAVASVPLKVTSVDIAVSPSLNSFACGTNATVTYTATFHFPAHNAGGQVMFEYTTTNGRGSTQAGLTVPPGTTTLTYQFTWSGQLPPDHTQPGNGGVIVTSPNAYTSQLVGPTGSCH